MAGRHSPGSRFTLEKLLTASTVYWISTALLSLLYLSSATLYLLKTAWVRTQLSALGYPGYLVPLLIVLKVLAVVAVLSRINTPLSDLAYAGMFFHLLLAAIAHAGAGKPKDALPAVIGVILLVASFATQNVAREMPSPHGDVQAWTRPASH